MFHIKRYRFSLYPPWFIIGLCLIGLCVGCKRQNQIHERVTFDGSTMGTSYRIVVTTGSGIKTSTQLKKIVEHRLKGISQNLSTYIRDSEISRLNQKEAGAWFHVSPDLYRVVTAASTVSSMTGGAFDITIGPAVELWGFGDAKKASQNEPPTEEQILVIKKSVGYQKLEIREKPPAIKKLDSNLKIDVSAIAKGYGVDEIVLLLQGMKGIHGAMVEIGGEVRVFGDRHDGSEWTVGIQSPVRNRGGLAARVHLQNKSIASSGDYVHFFKHEGRSFSHIMNPDKGVPVETDVVATAVIDASCMVADAWATAFMVLDVEKSLEIADREALGLMIIRREATNDLEVISNNTFKKYLVE
ncbi:FAD:protein FMN transferase [Pirellulales bacterium]|nr:FAD:protein FMN transferase [Pirellulales bacterium]